MDEIEQKVYNYIIKNSLVKECKLLVAVSGGPDSICLLHVLHALRDELNLSLHVVHLNHRLRGTESEADAKYVADIARSLDVPATIEARDVASFQKKHRLSPEEAAREVRYGFIAAVAASIGATRVAVGHTVDDNIETILMHLVRGSGTQGLTGLRPVSWRQVGKYRLEIIRPLLEVSREETQAYCKKYNLAPRIDSTNFSLSPLRNKIRLQLLPILKSYNPDVTGAILRMAEIAANELAALSVISEKAWKNTVKIRNNTAVIDKVKFNRLVPAMQRLLVRHTIESLRSDAPNPLKDIETVHIDSILQSTNKPAGKTVRLPYGLNFCVEYDKYILGADPAAISPFPPFTGKFLLEIPGETKTGGWKVTTTIVRPEQMEKDEPFTAYFDFDKVSDKLSLTSYRPGDRFQPLGMTQPKKVSRFLVDSRVPRIWRERVPVLRSPDKILWVAGYRIDERTKVTPKTEQILRVRMRKI